MNLSDAGVALIQSFEGLRLGAYPDPGTGGEPYTIGFGHTGGVRRGDTCTPAQARAWLAQDTQSAARGVADVIEVPVTQNQFDACVSLAYNIGLGNFRSSSLLKLLNQSRYAEAADQFPRWNRAAGKVMQGLINRRAKERAYFLGALA